MERLEAAACTVWLRAFDVKINHDGILASYHHGLAGFVGEGVDLLVRHVGWYIDEVARPASPLNSVVPIACGPTANDVKDGFIAVVVGTGLGVGLTTTCLPTVCCSGSGVRWRRPGSCRRSEACSDPGRRQERF